MNYGYFAASNSSEGFKSYYGEIFERADRLYVIKGGPGTGKSSLMKRLADAALRKGYKIEYYYCSSDPSSLDGVFIEGKNNRLGIIDGTFPHVWEPTHAGVREEIINLGQFWDSKALRNQKNEIFALSNKKSAAFKRAYAYLRSCGNLRAVTDSLVRKATDFDKLQAAAKRLALSLELDSGDMTEIPSAITAVSMNGKVRFDTIEKNSDKIWCIGDFYGVGQWFLDAFIGCLHNYNVRARIAHDCIEPRYSEGVLLESHRLGFVIGREEDGNKYINPKRFVRTERIREIRSELRYASKLYSDCLDGALHSLAEARLYHFLLEDIYKHAMDFSALNEFYGELAAGIFEV